MTVHVRTRQWDNDRPLLDLPPVADATAWVRDGDGLVAWGEAVRLDPGPGADRFERADETFTVLARDAEVEDAVGRPGTGLVAVGSFTFDADTPGSVLRVPQVIVGRHEGVTWLTTIEAPERAPVPPPAPRPSAAPLRDRPRYAGSSKPELHWLEAVAEAIDRIGAGELEKVVLARDYAIWSHHPFDALDVARGLAARFPSCHTFIVDDLVGATPELLVSRSGSQVRSRVLAGTIGRADDEVEDAALGAKLLASEKDQHEHTLAVTSVDDVLAPRCARLVHDPEPGLLRLDNLQHLATSFDGELDGDDSALALAGALHPTAAVGGTPRAKALPVIRELEGMDRGRYAGPVGWVDAAGDGEWGIALRCAQLSGARARLFAGNGIVSASLPEAELEETRLKLLAMQAALGEC